MDGRKFTGWIYVVYEKTEQWVKVKKKKKKLNMDWTALLWEKDYVGCSLIPGFSSNKIT